MMRYSLLILMSLIFINVTGQKLKLKKNCIVDTLNVTVKFGENFPVNMQESVLLKLESIIELENKSTRLFKIISDSLKTTESLIINLDELKYVDLRRNLETTAFNLLLLSGSVYFLIKVGGWFYFLYFSPTIVSDCEAYLTNDLIEQQVIKKYDHVSASAFWINEKKQESKYLISFEKYLIKKLNKIEKEYKKIN